MRCIRTLGDMTHELISVLVEWFLRRVIQPELVTRDTPPLDYVSVFTRRSKVLPCRFRLNRVLPFYDAAVAVYKC